jgi:hypothetical protein
MAKISLSALVIALTLIAIRPAAAQDLASSVVGTWKITSHVRKEVESGATVNQYGQKPIGHIIYTKGGHFVYLWVSDTRTVPSGVLTDADRANLHRTMVAGGGKYKVVDGKKIIFSYETSSLPLLTGADEASEAEISGKTLTVATAPFKSPRDGEMVTVVTTWERIE